MYILFERKKDNKNKARRNEMLQKKSNPNLAKARFLKTEIIGKYNQLSPKSQLQMSAQY